MLEPQYIYKLVNINDSMAKKDIYLITRNLGLSRREVNKIMSRKNIKKSNPDSTDLYKAGTDYGTVSSSDIYKAGTKYGTVGSSDIYKAGTRYGTVSSSDVYKAGTRYGTISPKDVYKAGTIYGTVSTKDF